ncbi:hypothetical protein [Streptomyces daliensis]|uniref:Uncharacterized protein n=1 Tax=Streptomyces daliensis TaxID=299421 RepID=A0A8T4IXH8_9ACTN|nr:hypothetical protein [Streptomyces daliensis]
MKRHVVTARAARGHGHGQEQDDQGRALVGGQTWELSGHQEPGGRPPARAARA